MFHLRLARAVTRLSKTRVPSRGTATYEYRMYGDADGPNYHLVQYLTQEMQREEVSGANVYKMRAFATAIKAIHELDFPIRTSTHIKDIPGIGEGISRRIMEFLGTTRKKDFRTLSRADQETQKKDLAIQELQRINGIGPIKARALVESGCMSVKQLHEERFLKTLSKAIQASLKYERDIEARVTRPQAETFLASMCQAISGDFRAHIMGSYRRGKPTSADIDILLFHPLYTTVPIFAPADGRESPSHHRSTHAHIRPPPKLLHDSVVAPLTEKGIIVSSLSGGQSRWQGLVNIRLENEEVVRRADIFLMPTPSEASAFLAFTGDAQFNLDCRARAKKKGMHLNEYGLWRQKLQDIPPTQNDFDDRGSDWNKSWEFGTEWELVETPDEAALLQELDMGYIVPERRNLSNLNLKDRQKKAEGINSRRSQVNQPQKAGKSSSRKNSQPHGSKDSASGRERKNSPANHRQLTQTGGSQKSPTQGGQSTAR